MANTKKKKQQALPFNGINYALFVAALVGIGLGFLLLSSGSLTAAPIVLVFSYLVLIPAAIMWGHSKDENQTQGD